MRFFIYCALALAAANCQQLDPSILSKIFGDPKVKLEEITVRPTEKISTYQDDDGDACQCVPYYLCDSNLNAVYLNDPTITGFGILNVRTIDECQESVERCCKIPKIDNQVKRLQPDSSRLKGCGYRNVKGLDFTLAGGSGNEAEFGEFPWVMGILDARNNSYYGVGVLIHPQVVMTGAHIVRNFEASSLKIRAGEWDTQTEKERLPFQERQVAEIRARSDFIVSNLHNDVALLKLAQPLELADHINVICMPDQDELFNGYKNCIANGWGKKSFGRKFSYAVILKKVEIDIISNTKCNSMLKNTRLGYFFKLHKSFVCAGGEEGKDACEGDGGAPLVCPVGDNRYKLTGLVSWGIGCGESDVPGVYARVAIFRKWVDEVMAEWNFDTSGYKM